MVLVQGVRSCKSDRQLLMRAASWQLIGASADDARVGKWPCTCVRHKSSATQAPCPIAPVISDRLRWS